MSVFPPIEMLSRHLRRLRLAQGLTQVQLAERTEMDVKHLQKIEAGTWTNVRLSTIHNLADALKVESWELLRTPQVRVVPPLPGPKTPAKRKLAKKRAR